MYVSLFVAIFTFFVTVLAVLDYHENSNRKTLLWSLVLGFITFWHSGLFAYEFLEAVNAS